MNNPKNEREILTPEQYAEKLQIGRSTLFQWLARGILIEGEHYFRVGRVIRFLWDGSVLMKVSDAKNTKLQKQISLPSQLKNRSVNWNY